MSSYYVWCKESHTGDAIGVGTLNVLNNCIMNNIVNHSVLIKLKKHYCEVIYIHFLSWKPVKVNVFSERSENCV